MVIVSGGPSTRISSGSSTATSSRSPSRSTVSTMRGSASSIVTMISADRPELGVEAVLRERAEGPEALVLGPVEVRGARDQQPALAAGGVQRAHLQLGVRGVEALDAVDPLADEALEQRRRVVLVPVRVGP